MVGPFLLKGSRLTQAKRLPIINIILLGSSVAEQVTVNHLVAGSNPARAATPPLGLQIEFRPAVQFPVQGPSTNPHELSCLGLVATRFQKGISQ